MQNKKTNFIHLGLIDYKEAWDYQTKLFEENLAIKAANRTLPNNEPPAYRTGRQTTTNYLIFCEHPHVYTLGKSGKINHLLLNEDRLKAIDATYYHINRGGDITYHGPGQIVGYPILDLDNFFTDIHKYMRFMEEAIIQTLTEYGIEAGRIEGMTGVWLDPENPASARKISAFGVKSSRWVTMHGFAFNVNTNLEYFNHIVPCGIPDKAVTSLQKELGRELDMKEVEEILKDKFASIFEMELIP